MGVCTPVSGAAADRRQAGTRAGPRRPAAWCQLGPPARRGPAARLSCNGCSVNSALKNGARPGGRGPAPSFRKPAGVAKGTLPRVVSGPGPAPGPGPPSGGTARHRPVQPPSAWPGRRAVARSTTQRPSPVSDASSGSSSRRAASARVVRQGRFRAAARSPGQR